jgi:hypothetical protein
MKRLISMSLILGAIAFATPSLARDVMTPGPYVWQRGDPPMPNHLTVHESSQQGATCFHNRRGVSDNLYPDIYARAECAIWPAASATADSCTTTTKYCTQQECATETWPVGRGSPSTLRRNGILFIKGCVRIPGDGSNVDVSGMLNPAQSDNQDNSNEP